MHADADDLAALVRALSFQLVDATSGQVVAELTGGPISTPGGGSYPGDRLVMHHLDASTPDSELQWTTGTDAADEKFTAMRGPTAVGSYAAPAVRLRDAGGTVGYASVESPSQVGTDVAQLVLSETLSGPQKPSAKVEATTGAAYGGLQVDANAVSATVKMMASGPQLATITANSNGGHVDLEPDFMSGRLRLGITHRSGYLPLGGGTAIMPGNTNVNNAGPTFLITPGPSIPAQAGDLVRVAVQAPFTTTGATVGSVSYVGFQAYLAGVPTGIYQPLQSIPNVAAHYGGDGLLMSGFFQIPTAGTWSFTCTAQTSSGTITYIAGNTQLTVEHWGIR